MEIRIQVAGTAAAQSNVSFPIRESVNSYVIIILWFLFHYFRTLCISLRVMEQDVPCSRVAFYWASVPLDLDKPPKVASRRTSLSQPGVFESERAAENNRLRFF
jgi:hypothetical protein